MATTKTAKTAETAETAVTEEETVTAKTAETAETAVTEEETVTADVWTAAVRSMRRNYRDAAAVRMFPLMDAAAAVERGRHVVGADDIAAAAFLDAAAAVGLEDLTDAAPAVEQGRQYQTARVVLLKGKGKRAEELASVRIPATRGRVNVCAWFTSIAGHVVTPVECPLAFVEAEATHKTARVYRDGAGRVAAVVKTTRDGRPVARKVGVGAFVRDYLAPVIGACVWTATDTGRYHIGYDDSAHVVTF